MQTRALSLSLLAEAAVAIAVLGHFGTGPEGAQIAARATARTSALIFALAVAWRTHDGAPAMLRGFVAAHAVHYATVTYLAVVAVNHHLHHLTPRSVVAVAGGVALLVVLWATADGETPAQRRANAAALWLAWAIFTGGALLNGLGVRKPQHPLALIPVLPLVGALIYHVYRATHPRAARSAGT